VLATIAVPQYPAAPDRHKPEVAGMLGGEGERGLVLDVVVLVALGRSNFSTSTYYIQRKSKIRVRVE
jgi:hypothetical protein